MSVSVDLATESTDRSITNELMTVIWAHGQAYGDTSGVGDFYRPNELKYHSRHRGLAAVNFFGRSKCDAISLNLNNGHLPIARPVKHHQNILYMALSDYI